MREGLILVLISPRVAFLFVLTCVDLCVQPFSATLLTRTGAAVGAACSMAGTEAASTTVRGDSVEEDEKKLHLREGTVSTAGTVGSSSTLQVAVLLQMPSPRRAEAQNDTREELLGYRGELAIGLIEVPWTSEDHYSRERTTSPS